MAGDMPGGHGDEFTAFFFPDFGEPVPVTLPLRGPVKQPGPDRGCQCRLTACDCRPCPREMTQEDLLCDACREARAAQVECCHQLSEELLRSVTRSRVARLRAGHIPPYGYDDGR